METVGSLLHRDVRIVHSHYDDSCLFIIVPWRERSFGRNGEGRSGKFLQQQVGHIPEIFEVRRQWQIEQSEKAISAGGKRPVRLRICLPLPLKPEPVAIEFVGIGWCGYRISSTDIRFSIIRH